ncbi:hypothetical protein [Streptomyces sp. NBC_00388]|uniref:hypothetical protein n=1 Tax=Streptomyces sp. NBC_00388 TaxID=2975735 RepID=UPI002E2221CE
MGDIPGAREELDRLGRALRAQLVVLIADLTPGSDPGLLFLGEPAIVDWHEPLRLRYSALFRGERPVNVSAAGLASRAAALLRSAGWEVAVPEENDGVRRHGVVTGRLDGSCIDIRAGDHTSAVMFEGRTPAMVLHTPQQFPRPDPVRTPGTVTPGYVLCYECDGLGACPGCGGRGWVPDRTRGRTDCPECHRGRVCVICRGPGQLALSRLSPYQRGHYPESGQGLPQ